MEVTGRLPEKDIFQPGAEVDVIGFARSRKALQGGQVLASAFAAGKQPVLAAKHNRTEHIFGGIF